MNIFKQALEKIQQQQQMLAILVFTFVAAIMWIAASLFTSQQKTGISRELLNLSKPLTPSIDEEVIQRLRGKGVFFSSQLQNFPIYMIRKDQNQIEEIVEIGTQPEPTPSPSPRVSPSPNSSPTTTQP